MDSGAGSRTAEGYFAEAENRSQRIIDFVCDTGNELAQRGELGGLDELFVGQFQAGGAFDDFQFERIAHLAEFRSHLHECAD